LVLVLVSPPAYYRVSGTQAMTETPNFLPTQTPPGDLLSDLLDTMHLSGTVLFRAEFDEPWSVTTPDCHQLARMLPFHAEHIIPFHVIAAGGCTMEMTGCRPVWLGEGDAVMLPYGDAHLLSGRQKTAPVPVGTLLPAPPWSDILVVQHGGPGTRTIIICGFVQCDELQFHPILRELPKFLQVSTHTADPWLAGTVRHTADEAMRAAPGSRSMLSRLTEVMFVEILRNHMQGLSADAVGWFAALNDPVLGPSLKRLHSKPFDEWSVESLAREVGVSRTVLAERFKHFLDQPPMKYLAQWRLQIAAQKLKANDVPLKLIADEVGYESEAAFSRAFKRLFGSPPADWRRIQMVPTGPGKL
jgi:AraC family transcriptional regulator, alkane utilization regulator